MSHRDHYVPQFYLKKFTDSKRRIWCYPIDGGGPKSESPKEVGYEDDFHTFITDSGGENREAESALGRIEDKGARAIRRIIAGQTLLARDREAFAVFTASMIVRVPKQRDQIGDMIAKFSSQMMTAMAENKEIFHAIDRKRREETGDVSDEDPEVLRQFLLSDEYVLEADPKAALVMSFETFDVVVYCLLQMKWCFCHSRGSDKFITSDRPVFYWDPTRPPNSLYGVGLSNPGLELTFPLSPKVVAMGAYDPFDKEHVPAPFKIVETINRRTVRRAGKLIFASENSAELTRFISENRVRQPDLPINNNAHQPEG